MYLPDIFVWFPFAPWKKERGRDIRRFEYCVEIITHIALYLEKIWRAHDAVHYHKYKETIVKLKYERERASDMSQCKSGIQGSLRSHLCRREIRTLICLEEYLGGIGILVCPKEYQGEIWILLCTKEYIGEIEILLCPKEYRGEIGKLRSCFVLKNT